MEQINQIFKKIIIIFPKIYLVDNQILLIIKTFRQYFSQIVFLKIDVNTLKEIFNKWGMKIKNKLIVINLKIFLIWLIIRGVEA